MEWEKYNINWEWVWVKIASFLDIRTFFCGWARTCRMWYKLTKDEEILRSLVQKHIPENNYGFLRVQRKWIDVFKLWTHFQSIIQLPQKYPAKFLLNRRTGELLAMNNNLIITCSLCHDSCYHKKLCRYPFKHRYRFTAADGLILCPNCINQTKVTAKQPCKVIAAMNIAKYFDTDILTALVGESQRRKGYTMGISTLVTLDDLKYEAYTHMKDHDLRNELSKVYDKLDNCGLYRTNHLKRKREIEEGINAKLEKTRTFVNKKHKTTINYPLTYAEASKLNQECQKIYKSMNSILPHLSKKDTATYFEDIHLDLTTCITQIQFEKQRIKSMVESHRALQKKEFGSKAHLRRLSEFWIDIIKARGLLNCKASYKNGKPCKHFTDGLNKFCSMHLIP